MIFHNVDHLNPSLTAVSASASSQFMFGVSHVWRMIGYLEANDIANAASEARSAIKPLSESANLFHKLSVLLGSDFSWFRDEARSVDVADAARTVYLSPDSQLVRSLNRTILSGEIDSIFQSCSEQTNSLAATLERFAKSAVGESTVRDTDIALAHELLRDLGQLVAQGQHVSSVCLLARRIIA